jgi:hypothetical protein
LSCVTHQLFRRTTARYDTKSSRRNRQTPNGRPAFGDFNVELSSGSQPIVGHHRWVGAQVRALHGIAQRTAHATVIVQRPEAAGAPATGLL